jgi:predicted transcriptional regulator
MEKLTKVDKVVNESLNQWALSVFQRLEREHPEVLDSLLNENKDEICKDGEYKRVNLLTKITDKLQKQQFTLP